MRLQLRFTFPTADVAMLNVETAKWKTVLTPRSDGYGEFYARAARSAQRKK